MMTYSLLGGAKVEHLGPPFICVLHRAPWVYVTCNFEDQDLCVRGTGSGSSRIILRVCVISQRSPGEQNQKDMYIERKRYFILLLLLKDVYLNIVFVSVFLALVLV
jgi:hypothetical protein